LIEKISFPGVDASDQQTLRTIIPVREGQSLNREALQESMRVLFATGRFSDLAAECQSVQQRQIELTFPSTPNFFIGLVSVEGAPARPTESQMVNASKLQLGELFTPQKIDAAIENIKQLLQENGYYRGTVSYQESRVQETQQVEVTFHVHPGEPARIGSIAIQGGGIYSPVQIQDIARLHPGDVVSASKISDALDRIRKSYQSHDRWLAQVTVASKVFDRVRNSVDYILSIEAGPKVVIRVDGFHISRAALRRNVPVYE